MVEGLKLDITKDKVPLNPVFTRNDEVSEGNNNTHLLTHTSKNNKEKVKKVTINELDEMPHPRSLGKFHYPIKYSNIVRSFDQGLEHLNIDILSRELVLCRNNKLLIGAYEINGHNDITLPNSLKSKTLLMYMASEAQLTAMRARVGANIFACDNLMLSGGSVLISKKFTSHAQIINRIWQGIKEWIGAKQVFEDRCHQLNTFPLTDDQAGRQILEVAAGNKETKTSSVVPFKYAQKAWDNWTAGDEPDTEPRTEWGLLNAWTRSLRDAPMQSQLASTVAVAGYYNV